MGQGEQLATMTDLTGSDKLIAQGGSCLAPLLDRRDEQARRRRSVGRPRSCINGRSRQPCCRRGATVTDVAYVESPRLVHPNLDPSDGQDSCSPLNEEM